MAPGNAKRDHMLLNPDRLTGRYRDDRSAEVMGKTVEFFENQRKGGIETRRARRGSGPLTSLSSCTVSGSSRRC